MTELFFVITTIGSLGIAFHYGSIKDKAIYDLETSRMIISSQNEKLEDMAVYLSNCLNRERRRME